MEKLDVLVLMGSPSDESTMEDTAKTLQKFEVPFRMAVASAHRTPDKVRTLVDEAEKDGKIVTSGGRVLGVTARGKDIPQAIERAYEACALINWDGAQYRTDIGAKAIKFL